MNNIILDSFNDTDNTALNAHIASIKPRTNWTQTASDSFKILGNLLQPNRNTNGDLGIIDSGKCDFTLSCVTVPRDNTASNLAYPGVVFRYVDSSNFWYAFADSSANNVMLYKVVAGVHTATIDYDIAITSGVEITIGIKCKGNVITLFIDGVEATCFVDAQFRTATFVGVRNGRVGDGSVLPQWNDFSMIPFDGIELNWPLFTEYEGNPIVALGDPGAFDDADANNPNVVYDPNERKYMIFWSGYPGTGSTQGLGVARANSLLGPYTKDPANPVFTGPYIQNGGHVWFKGKHYYYCGGTDSKNIVLAIGNTVNSFVDNGVCLSKDVNNYWEVTRVFDAFARLTEDGETVQLWYSSRDDANGINSICLATSKDGVNFTKSPLNPIFRLANIRGEPSVFVPAGKEGKEMLISYDFGGVNGHYRQVNQMITIDGGETWHHRYGALVGGGGGWMEEQVFDSCPWPVLVDNQMYMYHAGGDLSGGGLNLDAQLGVAIAPFPYVSLDAQHNHKKPFATKLHEAF